jgi:hypothetical protein
LLKKQFKIVKSNLLVLAKKALEHWCNTEFILRTFLSWLFETRARFLFLDGGGGAGAGGGCGDQGSVRLM